MRAEQSRAEQSRAEQSRAERLSWLDVLKGIGIILVVIGHVYSNRTVFNWLYSFHMPLFFLAAGWVYKEKSVLIDIKRRIQTIVVPYFSFGLLVLLYWQVIERRFRNSDTSFMDSLLGLFSGCYDNLDFNVHLWFLPCFFVTVAFFNILVNLGGRKFAWANWAVERFGEEKSVFFMGVSTGASIAMMSSNLGLPKSVRGIIDDCGFTSTMEMIDVNCKSHLPDYIPTRMFDFFVEMGTSVWGHFCISKADACKAVSQTDIPILIIHGDRDTQAPLSMAYRLYDSCSSEKQLYVVHGANHAENYRKDPEGYENVIAQFVEEHSGALKKEY